MKNKKPSFTSRLASGELLENRRVLAAFGTPWAEPRDLSISFPADGVQISSQSNQLHADLSEVATAQQWHELVLRAFQTWAIHADINIGLRADHDLPFGSPGLSVNDPRFGDFRIGGTAQPNVIANTMPFQVVAGSWSGDMLLNTNQDFYYHDWEASLPPDPADISVNQRDIFSAVLHEAGNALGLRDVMQSWQVMFGSYIGPKGMLTEEDIAAIQSLYGQRSDPFEYLNNNALTTATVIPIPVGTDVNTQTISLRGSVLEYDDSDYYVHAVVPGKTTATVRVEAAGVSLLKPRLDVVDAMGNVLASATATSVFDNNVTLVLDDLAATTEIRLRVSAAVDDVYAAGDYRLIIDYRDAAVQASDKSPGAYDGGIESLAENFELVDDELGLNDTIATAIALASIQPFSPHHRYEVVSSVAATQDFDFWKISAPSSQSSRLVVSLAAVGSDAATLQARIVDASGNQVGAAGRLRSDGTWMLEVIQPVPEEHYFIRVSVGPGSAVDAGNYVLTAEFATDYAQMNSFVSGTLSSQLDDFIRWTSDKTRLYRFDLSAEGVSSQHGVNLTFYDAQTKAPVLTLTSPSGRTRVVYALLSEGNYVLRFSAVSQDGSAVSDLAYQLLADGISDDQDPYSQGDDDGYGGYGADEHDTHRYPDPYSDYHDDPIPLPDYVYDYDYYG